MKKLIIPCFIVGSTLISCTPKGVPTASNEEKYKENLSAYRPTYERKKDTLVIQNTLDTDKKDNYVMPKYDITSQLDTVLDSIDQLNAGVKYIDGFTIQVYSGSNSEEARKAKGKIYALLPDSHPDMKFDEPNFKVKVGKFYSRMEAQKTYSRLRNKFSSAIIIPQRIYIE